MKLYYGHYFIFICVNTYLRVRSGYFKKFPLEIIYSAGYILLNTKKKKPPACYAIFIFVFILNHF